MLNAICKQFIVRAVGRRASQIPFSMEIGFSNSNARPSVRRSAACSSEPGIQIKAAPLVTRRQAQKILAQKQRACVRDAILIDHFPSRVKYMTRPRSERANHPRHPSELAEATAYPRAIRVSPSDCCNIYICTGRRSTSHKLYTYI